MAYSCDGRGIYEARKNDSPGTTVFSRPIATIAGVTPANTINVQGWSGQCGAERYFSGFTEGTGACTYTGH